MKFKKEDLIDGIDFGKAPGPTVFHEITGNGRWSIHHRRVFEFEGKFYETRYSVGATESQDESPYEYAPDEIECNEVFPVQRTAYEPAQATS